MTTRRTFTARGLLYRVELIATRRQHGIVSAYRLGDDPSCGRSLVPPTQINVLSDVSRARWIARHREEARTELAEVLHDVAQQYHASRESDPEAPGDSRSVAGRQDDPWPAAVEGDSLLTDLAALIRGHVVLSDAQAIAVALWVVHTHCMTATDYTPYLWVRSATPECGKSTLLELAARLVYRPKMLLNTSVAFLFRRIEEEGCTVFFDELDSQLRGEQFWAVSNILNAGFKRGQVVGRMEKRGDGTLEPKEYRVFGAKALGGIGRRTLADSTASRTIRIDLRRASPDELTRIARRSDSELDALCAPYRQRIARWATDHVEQLGHHRSAIPPELSGRPADITAILLAIADLAGGDWPRLARAALATLYGGAAESANVRVALLHDLRALFIERGTDFVGSTEACTWLKAQEAAPWAEFGRSGHGLTPKALADLLGDFDIRPEKHRDQGNQRGYFRAQFRGAWAAYSVDEEREPIPSAPRAPTAKVLRLNVEHGSGSTAQSAPNPLRSGLGADLSHRCAPAKVVLQRELALGAHGADGKEPPTHPGERLATGPARPREWDTTRYDPGDPV
jgi:hypothetical protein